MAITVHRSYSRTRLDGSRERMTFGPFSSMDEADRDGTASALAYGWTPPKWWQFWRWGDQPRRA